MLWQVAIGAVLVSALIHGLIARALGRTPGLALVLTILALSIVTWVYADTQLPFGGPGSGLALAAMVLFIGLPAVLGGVVGTLIGAARRRTASGAK